jgi:hypothetical protein
MVSTKKGGWCATPCHLNSETRLRVLVLCFVIGLILLYSSTIIFFYDRVSVRDDVVFGADTKDTLYYLRQLDLRNSTFEANSLYTRNDWF